MMISSNMETKLAFASLSEQAAVRNSPIRGQKCVTPSGGAAVALFSLTTGCQST